MTQTIRLFILLEAVSLVGASLIHSGAFIIGYEHPQARVAEGVIAAALIAGLTLSFVRRAWTRWVGLAAQGSPSWAHWSVSSPSRSVSAPAPCRTSSITPRS